MLQLLQTLQPHKPYDPTPLQPYHPTNGLYTGIPYNHTIVRCYIFRNLCFLKKGRVLNPLDKLQYWKIAQLLLFFESFLKKGRVTSKVPNPTNYNTGRLHNHHWNINTDVCQSLLESNTFTEIIFQCPLPFPSEML